MEFANTEYRRRRVRGSEDMTVPMGIDVIAAISLLARSSIVFGIFVTAQQPKREVESIVDMGQHKVFEAQPVSLI